MLVLAVLIAILVTVAVVATPVTSKEWSSLVNTEGGLISGITEKSTKGKIFYSHIYINICRGSGEVIVSQWRSG